MPPFFEKGGISLKLFAKSLTRKRLY